MLYFEAPSLRTLDPAVLDPHQVREYTMRQISRGRYDDILALVLYVRNRRDHRGRARTERLDEPPLRRRILRYVYYLEMLSMHVGSPFFNIGSITIFAYFKKGNISKTKQENSP